MRNLSIRNKPKRLSNIITRKKLFFVVENSSSEPNIVVFRVPSLARVIHAVEDGPKTNAIFDEYLTLRRNGIQWSNSSVRRFLTLATFSDTRVLQAFFVIGT